MSLRLSGAGASFSKTHNDPFALAAPTIAHGGGSSISSNYGGIQAKGVPGIGQSMLSYGIRNTAPKPPSAKARKPKVHVEKAAAGMHVEQSSERDVLNQIKNEVNTHPVYFFPGVDDRVPVPGGPNPFVQTARRPAHGKRAPPISTKFETVEREEHDPFEASSDKFKASQMHQEVMSKREQRAFNKALADKSDAIEEREWDKKELGGKIEDFIKGRQQKFTKPSGEARARQLAEYRVFYARKNGHMSPKDGGRAPPREAPKLPPGLPPRTPSGPSAPPRTPSGPSEAPPRIPSGLSEAPPRTPSAPLAPSAEGGPSAPLTPSMPGGREFTPGVGGRSLGIVNRTLDDNGFFKLVGANPSTIEKDRIARDIAYATEVLERKGGSDGIKLIYNHYRAENMGKYSDLNFTGPLNAKHKWRALRYQMDIDELEGGMGGMGMGSGK